MAIKSVRLPDGSTVEINEWLHWPLFSVLEFADTAAVDLRAFTYVVGQRVPTSGVAPRTATETDTNQVARTRMNHDEAFIVFNLTYEPFALTNAQFGEEAPTIQAPAPVLLGTNLRRLQRDLVVELFIGAGITKPQFRAPMSWIGQGCGPVAFGSGEQPVVTVAYASGTGGQVSPRNQRRLNLPIYIESDRVMYLRNSSPVGAIDGLSQDVRLRWYLDGLKQRPIA